MWERGDHKAMDMALEMSAAMLFEAETELFSAMEDEARAKANRAIDKSSANEAEARRAADVTAAAKDFLKHAKRTRNALSLKNMLDLSKPALVVPLEQLDANRDIMNTPDGIIELPTGKLRPHDPADDCTMITNFAPGDQGEDEWYEFLDMTTCEDGSMEGYLQDVAGLASFGKVKEEKVILAHGEGENGKSTLFGALGYAMGSYSGSIAVKILTTDKSNQGASLATLRGKRLVVTGELEEHQRLSVSMLKQIASTDPLVIEEKYRMPETITPSHTIVLYTNHLPRVGSTDHGTWRRLVVVPFKASIKPQQKILNYAEVLAQRCGPAIMKWIIQGAVNVARNGYKVPVPECVEEATEQYKEKEDWLNNFIDDICIKDPNATVGGQALYNAYQDWARETGDYIRRRTDFNKALESAGFWTTKPKNKVTWHGLKIDPAVEYGEYRYAVG